MLRRITGNTFYLPGPVNIGVYAHGNGDCTVIDTGIDKDTGRKILKALTEAGLNLARIINTHAHADHFGGNAFLVRRKGVPVWAPAFEAGIILYPQLEPFYLFSAQPISELQTKFLQAHPSPVDNVIEPGDRTDEGLEFIPLPGHSPGQLGIATPDGVLFCADAFFALDTLEKYYLPYFVDIPRSRETLRQLIETTCHNYYLPSHGTLLVDPQGTLRANLQRLIEIQEFITSTLTEPKTKETLLAELIKEHHLSVNPAQYYLYNSTIGAHLSGLAEDNVVQFAFREGRMYWEKT